MGSLDRTMRVFGGAVLESPPVLPIAHTALASVVGVRLGEYFTDAERMAYVMAEGRRRFGFDGVQLSLGVTAEAEALGARVEQPVDGAPVLLDHLLGNGGDLDGLRQRDVTVGGRMPLFFEAVARVVDEIGSDAFVLVTLRGPLLIGSQLRGVKEILIDMLEEPEAVGRLLDFGVEVALELGAWLRGSGAHGLLLGEATCSPSFIAPDMYRDLVRQRHRRLIGGLKEMGWGAVGVHICGNTACILEDIVSTGVDFMDLDYQVDAATALEAVRGRIALRGNLDPSAVFRFGTAERVQAETRALVDAVKGQRWILSSGCDIPPGTPAENLLAFVTAASGR